VTMSNQLHMCKGLVSAPEAVCAGNKHTHKGTLGRPSLPVRSCWMDARTHVV
jgi:hypothetical protein